jgi:hypothetical protein
LQIFRRENRKDYFSNKYIQDFPWKTEEKDLADIEIDGNIILKWIL